MELVFDPRQTTEPARSNNGRAPVIAKPELPTFAKRRIPMMTRTWIRRLLTRKPCTIHKGLNRCRPGLETLEDRLAPATFNPLPATPDGAAGSLRAAIVAANQNADATNTINLTNGTYTLSEKLDRDLQIVDQNDQVPLKTLTITGHGAANTIVAGGTNWGNRIFEILSQPGQVQVVTFQDLAIQNGHARDAGFSGKHSGYDGWGGGLLINGGDVTLTRVVVQDNVARGNVQSFAFSPGGTGLGGGIYLASGNLTVRDSTIAHNQAIGGKGADGTKGSNGTRGVDGARGADGAEGSQGAPGDPGKNAMSGLDPRGGDGVKGGTGGAGQNGGNGGNGQAGGTGGAGAHGAAGGVGAGGGIYVAGGQLFLTNSVVSDNFAGAGAGGNGGDGGVGGNGGGGGVGGDGGEGGLGGDGGNGGIASKTILNLQFARGGKGGDGGAGGKGGNGGNGGNGGDAGAGGSGGGGGAGGIASGGGIFVGASGMLTLTSSTVANNQAIAGAGGKGGAGGNAGQVGAGGLNGSFGVGGYGGPYGFGGFGDPGGKGGSAGAIGAFGVDGKQGKKPDVGGNGGAGGNGGDVGLGTGGGIYAPTPGSVTLMGTNYVNGSAGYMDNNGIPAWGAGGAGGAGSAGGTVRGVGLIHGSAGHAGTHGSFTSGNSQKGIDSIFQRLGGGFAPSPGTPSRNTAFTLYIVMQNADGTIKTDFNGTITVQLISNPASGTLSGTLQVKAVNGIAHFTNLKLNKAGTYRLGVFVQGNTSIVGGASLLFKVV